MKHTIYTLFAVLGIIWLTGCTEEVDESNRNGGDIHLSGSIDTRAADDDYPFWLYAVETGITSWAGNVALNTPDAVLNGKQVTLPQNFVQPFLFKNVDWIGVMRESDMNKSASTLPQASSTGNIVLQPGYGPDYSYLLAYTKNANPREAELPFKYLMSQVHVTFNLHDDIELESGETSLPVLYELVSNEMICDLLNNTQTTQSPVVFKKQVDVYKGLQNNSSELSYLTPGTSLLFNNIIINGSDATMYDTGIITEAGKSYTVELTIVRRSIKSVKVKMKDWLPGYDIEQTPLYTQIKFDGWQPVGETDINKTLSQRITRVEFIDNNTGNKVTAAVKREGTGNMHLEGYNLTHDNISSLCVYLDEVKVDVDWWVDRTALPTVIKIKKEVDLGSNYHILVANRKDLEDITLRMDDLYMYYQITDIDLAGNNWTPIGFDESSPVYFNGHYDGQGFRIKNMKIDMPQSDYVGLFSQVGRVISNLTLESIDITGKGYVGGICGSTENEPFFTNIHITTGSKITGVDNVGGICGKADYTIFESCSNGSDINGDNFAGGIVGQYQGGGTSGCLNTGNIHCVGDNAGGVTGMCTEGGFSSCANRGIITGEGNNYGGIVGSISGMNIPSFYGCYNSGNVSPERQLSTVGAITGLIVGGTSDIYNCYWTGNISSGTGSEVGTGIWNNHNTYPFSIFNWPHVSTDNWELYLGSNTGYWKSFGRLDNTYPIYPVFWFE